MLSNCIRDGINLADERSLLGVVMNVEIEARVGWTKKVKCRR